MFNFDAVAEANDVGEAFNKVNRFVRDADSTLASTICSKGVFWKEATLALIAIAPAIIEGVNSFLSDAGSSDKEKEKERAWLIAMLKQNRIAEWQAPETTVAFNLETQSIIPTATLTEEVLRQASTAIYVNKWSLRESAGKDVVAFKLTPSAFSSDYVLFTGRLSDLATAKIAGARD